MDRRFLVRIPDELRKNAIEVNRLIQDKIDICSKSGGGIVNIPAGQYNISCIEMKSNVTLLMDKDCVLISSISEGDFLIKKLDQSSSYIKKYGGIITAFYCENIAITGGKIIGNGETFWIPYTEEELKRIGPVTTDYRKKTFRPFPLLLHKCDNVIIKDTYIEDSPVYASWSVDCKNMHFKGITVDSNLRGPNTDGLHFSSCIDVLIEDCYLITGDDALAVDANSTGFSQNIVIRNCTINTTINALRIYTGLDPNLKTIKYTEVFNVTMHDCKILNAACVLNLVAQNGKISGVRSFNLDINLKQKGTPIFMMTDNGYLEDVHVSNLETISNGIATIIGTKSHYVKNITMLNIKMKVRPIKKLYVLEIPDPIPSYSHHHFSPCNLFIRYAEDIKIKNLSVEWINNDEFDYEMHTVRLINTKNIDIKELDVYPYKDDNNTATVSIENGENVEIEKCSKEKIVDYLTFKGNVKNISLLKKH